jgi:Tfp pilus assembly protein PilN
VRSRRLRLRVGRSTLRAEIVKHGSVTWRGEALYSAPSDLADAIARLAAEAPPGCRRLTVMLEHPPVQVRTLADLPPVKRPHLTALVAQQAGRFFRKNGQPLVTDAVWCGEGENRVARAAAVEEPLVEAVVAGARAAGVLLETIEVADERTTLVLLPHSEAKARDRRARRLTRRLAITAGASWLAVASVFCVRLAWDRRAVERELAALQKPLAALLDARRELRDAEAELNAIAHAESDRAGGLAMLAGVTQALPDSSVLTSLAWSADGTGALVGAAQHATDVVARLDRLDALTSVRLGGPVVREPLGGRDWERFTILFGGDGGPSRREGS